MATICYGMTDILRRERLQDSIHFQMEKSKRRKLDEHATSDRPERRRTRFGNKPQLFVRKTNRIKKPRTIFDPSQGAVLERSTPRPKKARRPTELGTASRTKVLNPTEKRKPISPPSCELGPASPTEELQPTETTNPISPPSCELGPASPTEELQPTETTKPISPPSCELGPASCTEELHLTETAKPISPPSFVTKSSKITEGSTPVNKDDSIVEVTPIVAKRRVGRPRGSGLSKTVRKALANNSAQFSGPSCPIRNSNPAKAAQPNGSRPLEAQSTCEPSARPTKPAEPVCSPNRRRLRGRAKNDKRKCVRCTKSSIPKNKFIACTGCGRWCHQNCVTHRFMNIRILRQKFKCDSCRYCSICLVCPGSQVARTMLLTCIKCCKYAHPRCVQSDVRPHIGVWECTECHDAQPQMHYTLWKRTVTQFVRRPEPMDEELPNVEGFTVWEVVTLMRKHFPRLAHIFLREEIDGNTLLVMQRDDVLNAFGLQTSTAICLYEFIRKLQNRSDSFPY